MRFKVQPQLTLQGDPECGLYLRACLPQARGRAFTCQKVSLAQPDVLPKLGTGAGVGAAEDVAHCVTPRHSRRQSSPDSEAIAQES